MEEKGSPPETTRFPHHVPPPPEPRYANLSLGFTPPRRETAFSGWPKHMFQIGCTKCETAECSEYQCTSSNFEYLGFAITPDSSVTPFVEFSICHGVLTFTSGHDETRRIEVRQLSRQLCPRGAPHLSIEI